MAIGYNEFKKRIATKPNDPFNSLIDKYNKTLEQINNLTKIVKEYSKSERVQYVKIRKEAEKELKIKKQQAEAIKSNLNRMK